MLRKAPVVLWSIIASFICQYCHTLNGPGSSVVNYVKWAGDSVNGPGGSVFNYGFINDLVI